MKQKLTERDLFSGVISPSDLFHIVDVDDTTQDPDGSSYKGEFSKIVDLISAWKQDGNTNGSEKSIGTLDNFDLPFVTDNVERARFFKTGELAIGQNTTDSKVNIKGTGDDKTTFSLTVRNSDDDIKFRVFDSGELQAGDENKNLYIGIRCGQNNIVSGAQGTTNTGMGYEAMKDQRYGETNTAYGFFALKFNQDGSGNTAVGGQALRECMSDFNTGIGDHALETLSSGVNNTALGFRAAVSQTDGSYNTVLGTNAFHNNTSGSDNVIIGAATAQGNVTGNQNVYVGSSSANKIVGSRNVCLGEESLFNTVNGTRNITLGFKSAYRQGDMDSKLFISGESYSTAAEERDNTLLYGKMDGGYLNQWLVINGALYLQDITTPFNYFKIQVNGGVLQLTDSGSANAPI